MILPFLGTPIPSESSAYGWLMGKKVSEDLMGGVHRPCLKVGYIPSAQILLATAQTHGHPSCKAGKCSRCVASRERTWGFGEHMAASAMWNLLSKAEEPNYKGEK